MGYGFTGKIVVAKWLVLLCVIYLKGWEIIEVTVI